MRYNYRFIIILIPNGRFYCYTSWNTRRVFAKLNLGILKKDRKTMGVRYNYRFMMEVFIVMLVGFPPAYGSGILEEFSQNSI